jgi:ribosomal protein S18 acetylase RimI-like enzyme
MFEIRPIGAADRERVAGLLEESWGSPKIVSGGQVHDGTALPGFIAEEDGKIAGLILYNISGCDCEIVCLESSLEGKGIGSRLVEIVKVAAKRNGSKRVWLITTNDNTRAIRFYQKRGFSLVNIHLNAAVKARELKPEIPLYGFDGIPVLHEIEFEIRLE